MFKDKDKQREANRQASQRMRDKGMTQGMTQKMTNEGMTARNGIVDVIPSSDTPDVIPKGVTSEDHPDPSKDDAFAKLLVQTGADVCLKATKPKRGKVSQEDWEAVGRDFKAVGKDFETVGEDIRKAECSLVNMIEGKSKRDKDIDMKPFERIWEKNIKAINALSPKRGKDIKSFKDLPPDVQATIHRQSDNNVEFKKRTDIAINYQRQLPDRYHSVGVRPSPPIEGGY